VSRQMSESEKDDAVARYKRGQTLNHIGFALSRCATTVKAVLVERGIAMRERGSAQRDWGWRGA
jgi:hypothetical protein